MRRTVCFLAGAALVAAMPAVSASAQDKVVYLEVRTLDRAPLDSVWAFAGDAATAYYADASHPGASNAGAVAIDEVATRSELTVSIDGYAVTGSLDSTLYADGAILARDTAGRIYVFAASTQAERQEGTVRVRTGLTAVDNDTIFGTMTVADNMLLATANTAAVKDIKGWSYSTLAVAMAEPLADTMEFVADTVRVPQSINIDRTVVVQQKGHTLVGELTSGYVFTVNGNVKWDGGNGRMIATPASLFRVEEDGQLNLKNTRAEGMIVATLEDGGMMQASDNDSLTVTGSGLFAIIAKGGSILQVDDASFAGGVSGINLDPSFVGQAKVKPATIAAMGATYAEPVHANAYFNHDGYYNYYPTIRQAALNTPTGVIFPARNIPADETDTIANSVAMQMNGNSIMGTLMVAHTEGTVTLLNGYIEVLEGDDDNTSAITIDSIDVHSNFIPHSHTTQINNGRFNNIDVAGVQSLNISGGKFAGTPRTTLQAYLNPGKGFGVNTDADAALYPYKVIDGYTVTWINYDAEGGVYDSVYSNASRKIAPVLDRIALIGHDLKDGVGLDTLFIGWYVDNNFMTPWDFNADLLESDTTLYGLYYVIDRDVTSEYTVMHMRQNLEHNGYDTANVFTYADSTGQPITIASAIYYGYQVVGEAWRTINTWANGDIFYFYYDRKQVPIHWNAGEGYVDGNYPNHTTDDTLYFGDSINYKAHFATREGYTFAGWDTVRLTVPYDTLTINAKYTRNTYPVSWSIDGTDTDTTAHSVAYSGAAYDGLGATYFNDDSVAVDAILVYIKGTDTVRSPEAPVNAGTWTVRATPVDTAYLLGNDVMTLTINPAELTVSGVVVDTVKFHDGNAIAAVTNNGSLSGVVGNDAVNYNVIARYDNADAGTGKVITVNYSILGLLGGNYTFAGDGDTICHNGIIVEAITPDPAYGDEGNGIAVEATGYCAGNGTVSYRLTSGNPDQYKLSFSDAAFTNTGWQSITTPGQIAISVPADVEAGTYSVTVVFGDSRYPQLESNAITASFNVNLPQTYTMPLFSDVIALVDTCHCFSDVRWYHSTDGGATWTEVVEARDAYYYQEAGGLTGEYYVSATMNGQSVFTCPQDDVTTLIADEQATDVTLTASPNPATDRTVVRISGSATGSHVLRVMNVMGMTIESRTFVGDEATIDLGGMQAGNYIVSVDGIVVRVIKK